MKVDSGILLVDNIIAKDETVINYLNITINRPKNVTVQTWVFFLSYIRFLQTIGAILSICSWWSV